jgi:hypothetical protein
MVIQFSEVKELFDEFNKVTAKAQNIAIFCRDIELQKEQIQLLTTFI